MWTRMHEQKEKIVPSNVIVYLSIVAKCAANGRVDMIGCDAYRASDHACVPRNQGHRLRNAGDDP